MRARFMDCRAAAPPLTRCASAAMASWRAAIIPGALVAVVALAAWLATPSRGPRAETVVTRNVDFYVMIDTSPSMSIPATSRGIASLEAATQLNEKGCAFACHERVPDDLEPFRMSSGAPINCATNGAYADGTTFNADSKFPYAGRDNYDLARCLGATLRVDLVRGAVQDLIGTAERSAKAGAGAYRMALFETNVSDGNVANEVSIYTADPMDQLDACGRRSKEFDVYKLQSLTDDLAPTGSAFTSAGNISAMEVYDNNHQLSGHQNCNMDTNLDTDITRVNGLIPTAGNGASGPGNTPQEVLFIVTDAFNDPAPDRAFGPMDWDGSRCNAIKNRGILIAVLYTTYYSELLAAP